MKITIEQALTTHQEGKFEEAEKLYREILKTNPNDLDAYNNLGVLLNDTGRLDEAEVSYKKAIELKPDYAEAHNNLGIILQKLNRPEEAEASYKKAIELKPDYALACNNLGFTLQKLNRLEEAEASYKKAIEFKPDYAEAHNNFGIILQKHNKLEEAELRYKKAIELNPEFANAYNNLGIMLDGVGRSDEAKLNFDKIIELKPIFLEAHDNLRVFSQVKKLLLKIDESKIKKKKNRTIKFILNILGFNNEKILNPFISSRTVEKELVNELYKIKATELNQMKTGPLFGNGKTSNFYLFDEDSSILKNLEKDLIKIMCQAVKSEVYIVDSFFNIMSDGGGSKPHTHLTVCDKIWGLSKKKYSLQYYLSVGDQNSSDSGVFEMKDPDEKILPTNGMITIIPADRHHSAIYSGKIDRIMIGVNFYRLI